MSAFYFQNQNSPQSQSEPLRSIRFAYGINQLKQTQNRWRSQWLRLRYEFERRRREWHRLPIEEQQRREVRLWMWGAGILLTFITSLSVFDARQARSAQSLKVPEGLRLIRVQLIGPDHEAAMEWPDDVNRVDLYTSESTRPLLRGVDLWRSSRGGRGSFSVLLPEALLSGSGLPKELKFPLRAVLRSDSDVIGESRVSTALAPQLDQAKSVRSIPFNRRVRKPIIHTEDGIDEAQTHQLETSMEDDEDSNFEKYAVTNPSDEDSADEMNLAGSEMNMNASKKLPPQHTEDD
jgi:hypothetical protein